MRQNSLIEVPEDLSQEVPFSLLDELCTLGEFVTFQDPVKLTTTPTSVIHTAVPNHIPAADPAFVPAAVPATASTAVPSTAAEPNNPTAVWSTPLEELSICGDFLLFRDPVPNFKEKDENDLLISDPVSNSRRKDDNASHTPHTPQLPYPVLCIQQKQQQQQQNDDGVNKLHLPDPPAAEDVSRSICATESSSAASCSNVATGGFCVVPSPSIQEEKESILYGKYIYQVNNDAQSMRSDEKDPLIMLVDEDDSRVSSVRAVRDDNSSISYRRSPGHLSYAASPIQSSVGRVVAARIVTTTATPAAKETTNSSSSKHSHSHRSNRRSPGHISYSSPQILSSDHAVEARAVTSTIQPKDPSHSYSSNHSNNSSDRHSPKHISYASPPILSSGEVVAGRAVTPSIQEKEPSNNNSSSHHSHHSHSSSYRRRHGHLSYASRPMFSAGRVEAVRSVTPTVPDRSSNNSSGSNSNDHNSNIISVGHNSNSTSNNCQYIKSVGPYVPDSDTVRAVAPSKYFFSTDHGGDDADETARSTLSTTNKVMIVVVRRPMHLASYTSEHSE